MMSPVPAKAQENVSYLKLVPRESDRVQISWEDITVDKLNVRSFVRVLRYFRFIGDGTELWLFGSGLGDQAIMYQMGESFFKYLERDDPCLGRLMFSVGIGPYAFHPWKGDFNLYWAWGGEMGENWLEEYIKRVDVKPDVFLCPSQIIKEHVEDRGYTSVYLPVGVGESFKPLNMKRKGLAYVGGQSKSSDQIDVVIGPYVDSPEFEYHGGEGTVFMTLEELNRWYNGKQIAFGMKLEANDRWGIMSNRVTETLASGTPLVQYGYDAIDETLGFHYPYQTFSRTETEGMVNEILLNFEDHLESIKSYSDIIKEKHSYQVRLKTIFEALERMK